MSAALIQEIADTCQRYGYDFQLALRTARRDGVPWYRPANRDPLGRPTS